MGKGRLNRARSRLLRTAAVACAGLLTVVMAPADHSSGAPLTLSRVTVPMSTPTSALTNGTDLGPTDDSTPMQVSFILRLRNSVALQAKVGLGWPGPFLSEAQFASTYGQQTSTITAIENYLAGFGIRTNAYSDGLDISATGTVGEFGQALVIQEHNFRVKEPAVIGLGTHIATVYAPTNGPTLPGSLAPAVLAILGLSNYSSTVSNIQRVPTARAQDITSSTGFSHTPADFENRYNLTPLVSAGHRGAGRTIGIITFADWYPPDAYSFWNDVLGLNVPHGRIQLVPVDGDTLNNLTGNAIETTLDVEQAGAVAPDAALRVYQSPEGGGDATFADPFFAVASDNIADSVSVSWGHSETIVQLLQELQLEPSTFVGVLDEAFLEMAAQGQTAFAASGDDGPFQALSDVGTTNLSVNQPSDSPWVTSAGGTTLPSTVTITPRDLNFVQNGPSNTAVIPTERAWSDDYTFPMYAAQGYPSAAALATDLSEPNQSGGGGGFSTAEPRPIYQSPAIAYSYRPFLTPTQPQTVIPGVQLPTAFAYNPAPPLQHGVSTQGRGQPDLSADADGFTGYEMYSDLFGGLLSLVGGTSVVAPQLAGAAADIDSADGGRTGLWNPAMYHAAYLRIGSPFTALNSTTVYSGVHYLYQTDLDGHVSALPGEFSNDDLYYTGTLGAVWNPATGLGTPNFAKLAKVVSH